MPTMIVQQHAGMTTTVSGPSALIASFIASAPPQP